MTYLKEGTYLADRRFRITGKLGQGGFGITYSGVGFATVSGKLGSVPVEFRVAIKEFFMKQTCVRDDETGRVSVPSTASREDTERFRRKFRKEALALSKFNHPNIVKVSDVFDENDTTYYVMEYLGGGSLSERLKKEGALPEEEARRLILQVGAALQEMHRQKMCHLDVKPANILLDAQGTAKLIDFGISKSYDEAGQGTSTTPAGISAGYSPVEQYSAGGVSHFSPQSDVYSLGATLYALLAGQAPPEATKLFAGIGDCPPGVTPALWHLVRWAMNPNIAQRPQTVKAFTDRLTALELGHPEENVIDVEANGETLQQPATSADNETIPSNPPASQPAASPAPSSPEWLIPVSITLIAIACFIIAFLLLKDDKPAEETPTTTEIKKNDNEVEGVEITNFYTDDSGVQQHETFVYTGTVENGKPNGRGRGVYETGVYEGEYKNSDFEGKGTFTKTSGDEKGSVYKGTWRGGYLAEGAYYDATQGRTFIGTFTESQPNQGKWYKGNVTDMY